MLHTGDSLVTYKTDMIFMSLYLKFNFVLNRNLIFQSLYLNFNFVLKGKSEAKERKGSTTIRLVTMNNVLAIHSCKLI